MTTSEERKAEFVEGYEKWFALLAAARNLIAAAKRVTPDTSQWKDEMTPLLKAVEALPAPKRYTMPHWDELTYEQQAQLQRGTAFRPAIYMAIREQLAEGDINHLPLIPNPPEIEFEPVRRWLFDDRAARTAEILASRFKDAVMSEQTLSNFQKLLAANLRTAWKQGFDEGKHIYAIFPT